MKFLDKVIDCELKLSKSKRQFLKKQLSNLGSKIGGGTVSLFGLFSKAAGLQKAEEETPSQKTKPEQRWLTIYE